MLAWVLQHVPYEDPQRLKPLLEERGYRFRFTRFFASDPLPEPDAFELLIVMGGPMGTYEEELHPWLKEEKAFLRRVLERPVPILGVCLGAQLLAEAMGARVYPHTLKEIGWFPVRKTRAGSTSPLLEGLPDTFMAFHWHGDTFELPQGAIHLLESEGCAHQAFSDPEGLRVGLQFHLEVEEPGIEALIKASGTLPQGPYVEKPAGILNKAPQYLPALRDHLKRFLDNFLKRVAVR